MKKIGPPTRLIDIFVSVDDFVNLFDQWLISRPLRSIRQPQLSTSEMITLVVYYHHSGYKNFEYYYQRLVLPMMKTYFPQLVSYQRLIDLLPRLAPVLHVLTKYLCLFNKQTGCYRTGGPICYSKKLPVCDNKRIHSHKVFQHIADRGKSSTGCRAAGAV